MLCVQGAHEVVEASKQPKKAGQTAVLAALSFWDYSNVADVPGGDAYKATGRCFSVAAGRISYTLGFKGKPSTHRSPPQLCTSVYKELRNFSHIAWNEVHTSISYSENMRRGSSHQMAALNSILLGFKLAKSSQHPEQATT